MRALMIWQMAHVNERTEKKKPGKVHIMTGYWIHFLTVLWAKQLIFKKEKKTDILIFCTYIPIYVYTYTDELIIFYTDV